jgi:hypothetical protein
MQAPFSRSNRARGPAERAYCFQESIHEVVVDNLRFTPELMRALRLQAIFHSQGGHIDRAEGAEKLLISYG